MFNIQRKKNYTRFLRIKYKQITLCQINYNVIKTSKYTIQGRKVIYITNYSLVHTETKKLCGINIFLVRLKKNDSCNKYKNYVMKVLKCIGLY